MRVTDTPLVVGLAAMGNLVSGSPLSLFGRETTDDSIQLGPRPFYLVDSLKRGPLKDKLSSCIKNMAKQPLKRSVWSIGHRGGGTLQMPEESVESVMAGSRMGAGLQECDITFTKDRKLVCRHSQCDLHTTTNIVAMPKLNAKCRKPFQPAKMAGNGASNTPATAECCTSDITLEEYKSLRAKMDGSNPFAAKPEDYVSGGTPAWRTDLYASANARVMSLQDHIDLVRSLGLKFSPEIKTPMVEMPFSGNYTQEKFVDQIVETFMSNDVPHEDIFIQSFLYDDILYLLKKYPDLGRQAVFLDQPGGENDNGDVTPGLLANASKNLKQYADDGLRIVAPAIPYLLSTDSDGEIVASTYAEEAKARGLDIITWTVERSPPIAAPSTTSASWYHRSLKKVLKSDGDILAILDALWQKVGVIGVFSDWSATTTFYANCVGVDAELEKTRQRKEKKKEEREKSRR